MGGSGTGDEGNHTESEDNTAAEKVSHDTNYRPNRLLVNQ
jgi:hypothetical protein